MEKDALFTLETLSGTFSFSAKEILEKGRILFPVGPKYLNCHVIVTKKDFLWFRPAPPEKGRAWEAQELSLPQSNYARMPVAWLGPGKCCEIECEIPEQKIEEGKKCFFESCLHIVAMASPEFTPGNEKQVHDDFPLSLYADGKLVAKAVHYFREHDVFMQMLEDVWMRFSISPGKHTLTLKNDHKEFFLCLSRLVLTHSKREHLSLTLPKWALVDTPLTGRIFAVEKCETFLTLPDGEKLFLSLEKGWNSFAFTLKKPGRDLVFITPESEGKVEICYDLANEVPEVTVGYDMTVVPHDGNGFMDYLLDYTSRTQLGNLVVFRGFRSLDKFKADYKAPIDSSLLYRWGDFCRKHGIRVEAATHFDDGSLIKGAGDMLHSVGRHEWPGAVYAFDPDAKWGSNDMKEAMEHYFQYLQIEIQRAKKTGARTAFGDASGGHRYCYLAGVDFLRTETMVPHTQHLCSQARPASEALASGEWGVHIAIQHAGQPYYETHLGIYFLSLFQPWMMGASMIYEEDSLFQLFKEERQAWDDALTKGKRDMTREFFHFVKSHPRKGKVRRNIAFWEGRYAAPFNGFICDVEQTPDYSVWGRFGNPAAEWGHRQPEKCRQVLDFLMPGANTMPLRQKFDKRRLFFSGTPYGDFDEVPAEAGGEYLKQYKLLLNLGWNSCIEEDYEKWKEFVKNGGVLFTGLPQFSTRLDREILKDMRDLRLWKNGDLADLCGVRIKGVTEEEFVKQYNVKDSIKLPHLERSAIPSSSPEEDGNCFIADVELAGAKAVVWDADTGLPLITEFALGKGKVYLMTLAAYPGHERLQKLSASFGACLADAAKGEIYLEDPSQEVFWNVWEEENGVKRLFALNTDWTEKGGGKPVILHREKEAWAVTIKEREPAMFLLLPCGILQLGKNHCEVLACEGEKVLLKFHGKEEEELVFRRKDGKMEFPFIQFPPGEAAMELSL